MIEPPVLFSGLLACALLLHAAAPAAAYVDAYAGAQKPDGTWRCAEIDDGSPDLASGRCEKDAAATSPPPDDEQAPGAHDERIVLNLPLEPVRDAWDGASGGVAAGVAVGSTGVCVFVDPDDPFRVPVVLGCIPDLRCVLDDPLSECVPEGRSLLA